MELSILPAWTAFKLQIILIKLPISNHNWIFCFWNWIFKTKKKDVFKLLKILWALSLANTTICCLRKVDTKTHQISGVKSTIVASSLMETNSDKNVRLVWSLVNFSLFLVSNTCLHIHACMDACIGYVAIRMVKGLQSPRDQAAVMELKHYDQNLIFSSCWWEIPRKIILESLHS